MRISLRGLDIGFVYPCTKREVVDVFGKDLLDSISFDAKYDFFRKVSKSQKPPISGVVLAAVLVTNFPRAYLDVFETRADSFSEHVGHSLVTIMRNVMKPWTESKLAFFETEPPLRSVTLLAEYNESGIVLYELRNLNAKTEFIEIPTG